MRHATYRTRPQHGSDVLCRLNPTDDTPVNTPAARPIFEALERRAHLSAVPTAGEQLMLELLNRARANPAAEARRLGIDLNEGLAAGTITADAKPPLAMNLNITGAARDHAAYQLEVDRTGHAGRGGTNPGQRIAASPYDWTAWGENTAFNASSSLGDVNAVVARQHDALFVDDGIAGRGHRTNLLTATFREVGSGVATGDYAYQGRDLPAVVSVQDFARASGDAFLTGVAYSDAVRDDDFYDAGEGLGGVTVTARSASGEAYATTTYGAGGYALALPPGTYDVTATGGGLGGTVRYGAVSIGGDNVKRDFRPEQATTPPATTPPATTPPATTPPAAPDPTPAPPVLNAPFAMLQGGGRLVVNGTARDDVVLVTATASRLTVKLGREALSFDLAAVRSITVSAGGGNDLVDLQPGDPAIALPATIVGGDGADTLLGGAGDDVIVGDGGDDSLNGRGGDDKLLGGNGGDTIFGSGGDDTLQGERGGDSLVGGSGRDLILGDVGPDRLRGGPDADTLLGGNSNDTLYGDAGDDRLDGGGHNDYLDGGDGADRIDGGNGRDTVSYYTRPRGVRVTLGPIGHAGRGDDGEPGEGDDVLETVENVDGSRFADFLVGSDFANVLRGQGGDDTLDGGRGTDTLIGGDGDDVLFTADRLWRDVIDGGDGDDRASIDRANDLWSDVETLDRR